MTTPVAQQRYETTISAFYGRQFQKL